MIHGGVSIFLGANTAGGYVFEQNPAADAGHRTYILKGGPGCGQGLLLRHIAETAKKSGEAVTCVHSALDPAEADGLYLADSKTWILDGSVDQKLEPRYTGLGEHLVDLGACLRPEALAENKEPVLALYHGIEELRARADRFLSAAGTMLSDSFHLALGALDIVKTKRFALTLAKKYFPAVQNAAPAETRLFLSSFTGAGQIFFEQTLRAHAQTILAIEDEYGAAARIILAVLRQKALENGLPVISCLCGLHGGEKIDHLIIPSLSLAVCTSNRRHEITSFTRRYHMRRFSDPAKLRSRRQRLSFNRRAARELTAGACELLAEIRQRRRLLEAYYAEALDPDLLSQATSRLLAQL